MTPAQRAQLGAVCREHAQLPVSALWRLVLQAEIFTDTEIDELCREAEVRVVARVLLADLALRRRVEEEGRAALDDPFVQARLRHLVKADLETWDESEGR